MTESHPFLATAPFDLNGLELVRRVIDRASFTRAAEEAGLTQSAVTRRIQGIERQLGVALFERTTRSVRPTPAGLWFRAEADRLLAGAEAIVRRMREDHAGAPRQVRVGVSHSVALAHLPGLFHQSQRRRPEVACHVSHAPGHAVIEAVASGAVDVGVACMPARLPRGLAVTHRFRDDFALVAPAILPDGTRVASPPARLPAEWVHAQRWLLPGTGSRTGTLLRDWMRRRGWRVEPAMELEGYDLIVNLVALGMGVGFVPVRALAGFPRRHRLTRVAVRPGFRRDLVVVTRRASRVPAHVRDFVSDILF